MNVADDIRKRLREETYAAVRNHRRDLYERAVAIASWIAESYNLDTKAAAHIEYHLMSFARQATGL